MKLHLCLASLIFGAAESKMTPGKCPQVEYVDDFQADQYVGKWYEIFRDKWNKYTLGTDCVTKEFSKGADGNVDLYFRGYYHWMFKYSGINGRMYNCDEGSSDTFTCQATMGDWSSNRHPIKVFDTDYQNYEIYYDCSDYMGGLFKIESMAIGSRER